MISSNMLPSLPKGLINNIDTPRAQSNMVTMFILGNLGMRTIATYNDKNASPEQRKYAAARAGLDEVSALVMHLFLSHHFGEWGYKLGKLYVNHLKNKAKALDPHDTRLDRFHDELANFSQFKKLSRNNPDFKYLSWEGFNSQKANEFNSKVKLSVRNIIGNLKTAMEAQEKEHPEFWNKLSLQDRAHHAAEAFHPIVAQEMKMLQQQVKDGKTKHNMFFVGQTAEDLTKLIHSGLMATQDALVKHPVKDALLHTLETTESTMLKHGTLNFTHLASGLNRAGQTAGTVLAIGVATPLINNQLMTPVSKAFTFITNIIKGQSNNPDKPSPTTDSLSLSSNRSKTSYSTPLEDDTKSDLLTPSPIPVDDVAQVYNAGVQGWQQFNANLNNPPPRMINYPPAYMIQTVR